MATMKDVARRAGVSIATVSATLSGNAFVSTQLKERVNAAIEELGYAPNRMASGLKRGTSTLLGLIVPDITNPFFTGIVQAVQRKAAEQGFTVLLSASDDMAAREAELVRLMRSHQAAGTIVIPCGSEEDCRKLAGLAGEMPIAAVDNAPLGLGIDTVVIDNRKAAALATDHLLKHGHRSVAIVAGPAHRYVAHERVIGFEQAMEASGLEAAPERMRRGDFHVEAAREAALSLLSAKKRPTAMFAANNHMLIGVMQAIAELGLAVPKDVSVASIDDFPWAAAVMPALTTVRQPVDAIASAALDCLTTRIAGENPPPQRIVLEPELVVRQSCAAPAH